LRADGLSRCRADADRPHRRVFLAHETEIPSALSLVPDRAAGTAARAVRDAMMRVALSVIALLLLIAALAAVPWLVSDYGLGFMLNLMCYLVLTVAWALFSGTTRYVSLGRGAAAAASPAPARRAWP